MNNITKDIEILIKIPGEWIDVNSPTLMLPGYIDQYLRPMLRSQVVNEVAERIAENVVHEIKVSPEEVKDRVLTLLAKRALERKSDE